MVSKRSEYRNQYKKAILVNNIPTYFESLTYRNKRRDLEYAHTPISWDFEADDPDTTSPDEDLEKLPVEKLELSDIEEKDDDDDIMKSKGDKEEAKEEGEIKEDVVIEKQTPESRKLTLMAKEKLNKYVSTENRDIPEKEKPVAEKTKSEEDILKPQKVDDKTFIKRSKPRRPDRTLTIPTRPKSAGLPKKSRSVPSRPKSAMPAESAEKPPFFMYGCGDMEKATGIKKTHNVHCSVDIYPAALKALKQHQLRAKRREELQRKISARDKKKKNLFVEKVTKETTSWQSEYQQRYPTYDLSEYERRLKALEFARARKVKNDF